MPNHFGRQSQANLAKCHPALQALATRALELSPQDFTVTAGAGLSLAVAPYPADQSPEKYQAIINAFRRAAITLGLTLRWSGDFHFFADLTRLEIDEPAGGQWSASSQAAAPEPVSSGKTDGSSLTPALRAEYESLFSRAVIRPERKGEITRMAQRIADSIHWPRYEAVADELGCPVHLVALTHAMEAGLRFDRHLHNGDLLTSRTIHVPKGRPEGDPPFTWEESAIDALTLHHIDGWADWSLAGLAYVLERYNGWGYRRHHPEVPTPYLWSMTTAYSSGKYTSDGHFDSSAVSKQAGAMALLKGLEEAGKPYPGLPAGGAS